MGITDEKLSTGKDFVMNFALLILSVIYGIAFQVLVISLFIKFDTSNPIILNLPTAFSRVT
jgi:hypothetical protein